MSYLKDFIIPFEGLGIGNHEFVFDVNQLFFEEIAYSEFKNGAVRVKLDLEKQDNMLILLFNISGVVKVLCDRCAEEFNYPIQGDQQLLVQFGDQFVEESEDLIIIPRGDYEINLAPYIYEYICLLLPIQRIHPDDKSGKSMCNAEMLKKLNELSFNIKQDDPRWDVLKKLKKN
ncbi:MAG: DUF177 domain-containing protein [Bacteroidetes bacterium]|nr:DUF177 domain-containing protein [Bacteroidota bacterium]